MHHIKDIIEQNASHYKQLINHNYNMQISTTYNESSGMYEVEIRDEFDNLLHSFRDGVRSIAELEAYKIMNK